MQIAAPDITLEMNGHTFCLRPTLGAAIRLCYRYDGIQTLVRAVQEGHLSIIADIIAEASGRPLHEVRAAMASPVGAYMREAISACLEFLHAIADVSEGEDEDTSSGPSITFTELYRQLYTIATGWLSWPVQAALDATPAQIILAHRGRVDMLKAIFGSDDEKPKPSKPDNRRDADASEILRGLGG